MQGCGWIFDESLHYVDHLAPLCALLQWPLIVCDAEIAQIARIYYPDLTVIEQSPWKIELAPYVITCDPLSLLKASLPHHDFSTSQWIWIPHGHSDKGWKLPIFETLQTQSLGWIYGPRMHALLQEQNVSLKTEFIGNFRREYAQKQALFYEEKLREKIPCLFNGGKNFLYAPTWDDYEGNGSFWQMFPLLAQAVPSSVQLLVKLHPNTWRKFPAEIESLIGRYEKQQNIHFLPDFPPIYPLLSRCDVYIGDVSSIGYDFLSLQKPLFFLQKELTDPPLFLHQTGQSVSPHQLDLIFRETQPKKELIQQVYEETFSPCPNWKNLLRA